MDIKDFLYAWCGYNFFERPIYKIDVNPTGEHLNRFTAEISVVKTAKSKLPKFPVKTICAVGYGSNKKLASNESANKMCEMLVRCGLMDVSEHQNCTVRKAKVIPHHLNVLKMLDTLDAPAAKNSKQSEELKNSESGSSQNTDSDTSPPLKEFSQQTTQLLLHYGASKRRSSDDELKILYESETVSREESSIPSTSQTPNPPRNDKRCLDERDDPPSCERRKKRLRNDAQPLSLEETSRLNEASKEFDWSPNRNRALEDLDYDLWLHYQNNSQTEFQRATKFQLATEMTNYLRANYRGDVTLLCVGSTVTRLGSCNSDLDLCLLAVPILPWVPDPQDREATLIVLKQLRKYLYKFFARNYYCNQIEFIPAKVPILRVLGIKLGNDWEIDVDINVNNVTGIRNSHLLTYYAQCDKRFPALTLAVKHWAINAEICDAKNGMLSSYALALMVLHFLQSETYPAVLPNLQAQFPSLFSKVIPIRNLQLDLNISPKYVNGLNTSTLAALFIRFFDYYANVVDFSTHALSVLTASRFGRFNLPMGTDNFFIFIEEPFDLTNVARCVFKHENYAKIKDSFDDAYKALCKTFRLSSIGVK